MKVNIFAKVQLGFVVVSAITAVLGLFAINRLGLVAKEGELIGTMVVPSISTIDDIVLDGSHYRRQQLQHVIAADAEAMAGYETKMAAYDGQITDHFAAYDALITDERDRQLLEAAQALWARYLAESAPVVQLSREFKNDEAMAALNSAALTTFNEFVTAMGEWSDYNDEIATDALAAARGAQANAQLLLIIGIVAAAGAGALIGFGLARAIAKPLGIVAGGLRNFGEGDLNRDLPQAVKDALARRGDELGTLGAGLVAAEGYLIQMAEAAGRIAGGDLTVAVTPRSAKDELGTAFSQMIAGLQQAVGAVAENAASVGAAAGQLSAAAVQAGQATGQIATTVQQVARGTAEQTQSVTRTSGSMEQMKRAIDGVANGAQEQASVVGKAASLTAQISSTVRDVASNAKAGATGADEAAQVARQGAQTVAANQAAMQAIKAKVGVSAEKVREMGQRSDQIGAIVETIDDIASQTNLLALNAAIEAARAGEHGKGFAVVADEVRKLAERASAATKEIGTLIRGIQGTVTEAVAAMDEGAREVQVGAERANEAGQALDGILRAAESVTRQVSQIAGAAETMNQAVNALTQAMESVSAVVEENTAATEEMAAGASEVTQAIENIASVSEENSAAVEEVSASAEEMNAQVEEVTASAQSLSEMARALQQVVAQFTLADTIEAASTSLPAAGRRPAGPRATSQAPGASAKTPVKPVAPAFKATNGHRRENVPVR